MSSLPNQIGEVTLMPLAKQFALYDSLSKLAFRGFERLINLHMMTAKEAFVDASAATSTTNAVHAPPPVKNLMDFSHEVAMMSTDMHNEFLQALRTVQSDEPSSINFAFDGQAFNLPYFSLLGTLFTTPNEPSFNSTIENVIFKETKKIPKNKTPQSKTSCIKKSKPKVATAQISAPNKVKVSTVKKTVSKSKAITVNPALAEATPKTSLTSEVKAATAHPSASGKPSFSTIQRNSRSKNKNVMR